MADNSKREKVYHVFQEISCSYDKANERISLGWEGRWKKELVQEVSAKTAQGASVLDVCCGTGDIAVALAQSRSTIHVVGLDFSPAMLEAAKKKSRHLANVSWQLGDAMQLPFADNTFAAACISFGLRNTADYLKVLQEMRRVVKPGGWVYCLDSFVPDSPWIRPFYAFYFRGIMPILGGGFHHRKEYVWLWQSTKEFLRKKELLNLFGKAGLVERALKSYMFGACVLHKGRKPIGDR